MGLLDDLVGQLAGGAQGRGGADPLEPGSRSANVSAGGAGMEKVMMALLPVVLGMLARGQRGRSAGLDQGGSGGGLGDILGQVLGGSSGGTGGLGELLEQFQRAGLGDQVRSWVGKGQNLAIPPDAIEQVFGRHGVAEIARQAGVSEQDASKGLSQLMPEVVDRMTPDGKLPDIPSLLASVESFTKRLGLE